MSIKAMYYSVEEIGKTVKDTKLNNALQTFVLISALFGRNGKNETVLI